MMTEQQEALRLADALVKHLGGNTASQAAVELRRLHEVTESLWQVAHHRNDRITMLEAAMRQALEALKFQRDYIVTMKGMGHDYQVATDASITALTAALEQPAQKCNYPYCGCDGKAWCEVERNAALDKKAENAREIGLDYEPSAGTQVSKVWWDGEKLMTKPIPLESVYKEPEQQEPKQSEIFCGVDFADGMLSVSVLRRRPDHVAELIHAEQIELNTRLQAREPLTDEEIEQCMKQAYATVQGRNLEHAFARAIEQAHGIKEN